MRRLRRLIRRLARQERGANAVLIAFLIVPMLGLGALALDVSAQHAEHTQLQHGADAAAVAVAFDCANDATACGGSSDATAEGYLDGNGAIPVDGEATVVIEPTDQTVNVTASADFPHFLASLIDTDGDPTSTKVSTDATAAWGYVGGGKFIPLAIAECEIERGIADAGSIGTPFKLLTDATPSGGGSGPPAPNPCSDADYPGGFSWLDDDNCQVTLNPDNVAEGTPGNNTGGTGCPVDFLHDLLGETVLVALYDHVDGLTGSGSHGDYTISKFAAFHITGYSAVLPGGGATREYIGAPYNQSPYKFTGSERGLQGYFVEYISVAEALELTSVGSPGDPIAVHLID